MTRWIALVAVLAGCSYEWDALRPRPDSGVAPTVDVPRDTSADVAVDAGATDAGTDVATDVGPDVATDAGTDVLVDLDAGPMDTGPTDTGPTDTGARDTGPLDTGPLDTGPVDTGPRDTGPLDTGVRDTGPADTGPPPCTGPACPCSPMAPAGWCAIGATCTSGACVAGPIVGALVITEIMNDPDAVTDAVGEWFEVYNRSETPVDLRGLRVRGNGTEMFEVGGSAPLLVAGRGYAVLGITADTVVNGGVTMLYAYGSAMTLGNSSTDVVTLLASDGTTVIDAVTYGTTAGSGWSIVSGRAKSLRPAILDASMNDVAAAWCAAGPSFGRGDFGTPGAATVCQ